MFRRATRTWLAAAVLALCLAFAITVDRDPVAHASGRGLVQPPARLSETGLYADPAALTVGAENRPFSPQYPLWSDGAKKRRWIYLPPGTAIDATDSDAWVFPDGTKFWKEFAFDGRKVETRFLWKVGADDWVFATYVWNAEQTDATLAPERGVRHAAPIGTAGHHSIPAVLDCRACHDSRRTEILGFTALQLSTDRDPNALHAEPLEPGMVTLKTLVDEGLLSPRRDDLLRNPPRIVTTNPRTRSVLGYLNTNCGACHNAESSLAPLGLLLKHPVAAASEAEAPGLTTTVMEPGRYAIPGTTPAERLRIAPGNPDASTLLYRLRSRRPSAQMPPFGTVVPDQQAIDLFTRWIAKDLPRRDETTAQP
ncbi:MAG TPA: hypothetical protein VIL35_06935 [Vicinamibacterales bacterium]